MYVYTQIGHGLETKTGREAAAAAAAPSNQIGIGVLFSFFFLFCYWLFTFFICVLKCSLWCVFDKKEKASFKFHAQHVKKKKVAFSLVFLEPGEKRRIKKKE